MRSFKGIIKNRKNFPKCVQKFKQLKGISIGSCIDPNYTLGEKGSTGIYAAAHTHCIGGKYHGWICFRFKFQLKEKLTLLHEVAHLISYNPNAPHGKDWKKTIVEIGGTFKSYSYKHGYKTSTYLDYTKRSRKN